MRTPTCKQIKLRKMRLQKLLGPSKVYFYSIVYFIFFRLLKKGREKLRKGGNGVGKMEGRKGPVDFSL